MNIIYAHYEFWPHQKYKLHSTKQVNHTLFRIAAFISPPVGRRVLDDHVDAQAAARASTSWPRLTMEARDLPNWKTGLFHGYSSSFTQVFQFQHVDGVLPVDGSRQSQEVPPIIPVLDRYHRDFRHAVSPAEKRGGSGPCKAAAFPTRPDKCLHDGGADWLRRGREAVAGYLRRTQVFSSSTIASTV